MSQIYFKYIFLRNFKNIREEIYQLWNCFSYVKKKTQKETFMSKRSVNIQSKSKGVFVSSLSNLFLGITFLGIKFPSLYAKECYSKVFRKNMFG